MSRRISVEIVGDSRNLERAFARSSRSASKFQASITGVSKGIRSSFGGLGAAVGAGGVLVAIKKSIDAASDLNEEMSKSQQIFGSSAASVQKWSKTTTHAFKLSQTESLQAASNFGSMFKTIGLGNQQAASMSRRFTELGADMGSFNNQDPSEMLERLRSGLAGEAEPLRRFGVLLSEARVKQEAYRSGIAKHGSTLTEQQKVLARYNLILKDTRLAQGDAARTGGNWAGVQRELGAQLGNLGAKLGQVLLPKLTKVVKKWNAWLEDPEHQKEVIDNITTAVDGLATALGAVNTALGSKGRIDDWLKSHHLGFLTKSGLELGRDVHAFGLGRGGGRDTTDFSSLFGLGAVFRKQAAARRAGGGGGGGGGRDTGTTAEERARLAHLAAVRIAGVDARLARQLDRLQDLSLRKQLEGLRAVAQQIRGRLQITKDTARQLTLNDQLLGVLRQQRSVQKEIGDQVKATNQALKDRADAIKSAVLDRLQQRQTAVTNQRALRDARERLRIALRLGGPVGARLARENLADVNMDILRARIEAQTPTLNRRGTFALGNVITINVNGVTDPNAVAIKVDQILKQRARRSSNPTRGAAAGSNAGPR